MIVAFKVFLVVALIVVARVYVTQARSAGRDRLLVLLMLGALVGAVIYPDGSTWIARRVGISRGVDLGLYVGFLLLFFLAGVQRARLREQDRVLTALVRVLALRDARRPTDPGSGGIRTRS